MLYTVAAVHLWIFILFIKQFEELITLAGLIYVKTLSGNGSIVKELPTGTIYVIRSLLVERLLAYVIVCNGSSAVSP